MLRALARIARGITVAAGRRGGVFIGAAAGILALDLLLPPLILSVVRKPLDYFALNAWLVELPRYIFSDPNPWPRKLEFLSGMAIFWYSADSPYGGVDWGAAVTVGDVARFLAMALLIGVYFALVMHLRDRARGASAKLTTGGGVSGALVGALGVSTGGCTVTGCGAPIIPVVGLAFAGLSSTTLAWLAAASRIGTAFVFAAIALGVLYFAWVAGDDGFAGDAPLIPSAPRAL
jgi:hypothetical protein